MADATLWWLAAGALVAVELLSGTFYLLMLSTGMAAAAIAAHLQLASVWQWTLAAGVGGGSVLAWRAYKKSQPAPAKATANHDVNLDVGETVHVDQWQADGSCSVRYRGAQWDASLAPGEPAQSGAYTIVEVLGSRLVLKKAA